MPKRFRPGFYKVFDKNLIPLTVRYTLQGPSVGSNENQNWLCYVRVPSFTQDPLGAVPGRKDVMSDKFKPN